jgi:hypothetical protein
MTEMAPASAGMTGPRTPLESLKSEKYKIDSYPNSYRDTTKNYLT